MRTIKLVMGKPFPSYVEMSIVDITEGKERRRAGITADYSEVDIKPLIKQGYSLEEAVKSYDDWLNKTLRRYLLDECEIISGHEEFLNIVRESIAKYFDK
ncbi:MAG: hypothetical protein IJC41_03030 [Firmicutes bacterium]|nr:hypothetical protein [Bacillota bacterium]